MFCSWSSPYIPHTHFAPLWKAREDAHGCFSLWLLTHLQSRAISSHPAPGLRSVSLSSCGSPWNVGFRPFSRPWLCCKHKVSWFVSPQIWFYPSYVLARTVKQEPGLTFPAGRDTIKSQNPVSCVTDTLSTAHFRHSLVKLSALGQENCWGLLPRTPGLRLQVTTIPSLVLTTKNESRYCKFLEDKITPLRLTVCDPPLCDSHRAEGSCDPMMPVCEFLIDHASRYFFS